MKLLVALFLLAQAPTLAQQQAEKQAHLEQIKAELEQRRAVLRDLDNEERSLIESLGELDESLSRLSDDALGAQKHLDTLKSELVVLEQRAGLDEKDLAIARQRLEARLRALYVSGEGGTARALLGAEGYQELALRRRFLQTLAESDAKLVGEVARIEKSLDDKRQRLRDAAAEAAFTAKQIEDQRELIEATRAERRAAIARISAERALAKRAAEDLDKKREQLAAVIGKMIEEGVRRPITPANGKGILKGKLAKPVEGVLIRKYGAVKDKETGAEIVSNGIEIRAEDGAPVAAVADGRIVHVGWLRGFGRMILVDHGEGHHTLSAHLSRPAVNKGDVVKRGQTIGFVGDTESQNGPKLYFELREHGRPKDPLPYLK
jgi:murein hydrolase activator